MTDSSEKYCSYPAQTHGENMQSVLTRFNIMVILIDITVY